MRALTIAVAMLFNTFVFAADRPEYSIAYDPDRNAFVDFKMALDDAKENQKLVLLELGGDWCRWCHILDEFYQRNNKLKQQLLEVFVVMKVNVSEENWNDEFRSHLPEVIAYPHFFITDFDGHVIASQNVYEFEDRGIYSRRLFKNFINIWSKANQTIQGIKTAQAKSQSISDIQGSPTSS